MFAKRSRGCAARIGTPLSLAFGLLLGARAMAGCTLEPHDMPVELVDDRPLARLSLNGVELPFLLDSGVASSLVNPSTAQQLRLPVLALPPGIEVRDYAGTIDADRTVVDRVGLLGTELRNVDFLVGGTELGARYKGVIGRDFLSLTDVEYDLAHGRIRLVLPKGDCEAANLAYLAGEGPVVAVPLQPGRSAKDTSIRVEVALNGKKATAVLDTGSPTSLVSRSAADRVGIEDAGRVPSGPVRGLGRGSAVAWTASLDEFRLGSESVRNVPLTVTDVHAKAEDVVLGLDYLLAHRVYVSKLQQKVYLTWNGGAVFHAPGIAADADGIGAVALRGAAADDADALALSGAAAMAAGRPGEAREDLDRAVAKAPGTAAYRVMRARLHLQSQDGSAALVDLDEALRIDPALSDARLLRARLRWQAGRRADAQDDLLWLDSNLAPEDDLRREMAELVSVTGRAADAIRLYGLWISTHAQDPHRGAVLNARCRLRARLNLELDAALQDCRQAVRLDRKDGAFQESLGWLLLRRGDWKEAQEAFNGALAAGVSADALFGRALALSRLGDARAAQRDITQARGLDTAIDGRLRLEGFGDLPGMP